MIDSFDGNFAFLSNFYPAIVHFEGHKYSSNEHAFQAAKTFNEMEKSFVASAPTPGIAKRRGRSVSLRKDWEFVKDSIMYDLVLNKFKNNEDLKQKLLNTGNEELVEGNYWGDTYWGVDVKKGGQNKLGKILMRVREELNALSSN